MKDFNLLENASGGYSYTYEYTSFKYITGRWTVPSTPGFLNNNEFGDNNENAVISCWQWLGMAKGVNKEDGFNTESMIQFGVVSGHYLRASIFDQGFNKVFYRWMPHSNYVEIDNFPVTTGDTIIATICTNEAGATCYISNLTTGNSTSFTLNIPYGEVANFNVAGCAVGSGLLPTDGPDDQQGFADYGLVIFDHIHAGLNFGGEVPPSISGNLTINGDIVSKGYIYDDTAENHLVFCDTF